MARIGEGLSGITMVREFSLFLSAGSDDRVSPIVIMDSGAGGLTVFEEINRLLPWLPVIYCADNAGFPYGLRSEEDVVQRVCLYLRKLYLQYNPSLAIIACNTASTVALEHAREELPIPIVGVAAVPSLPEHETPRKPGRRQRRGREVRRHRSTTKVCQPVVCPPERN